jgi:transcriptional regulator with XRE-family HTH domain
MDLGHGWESRQVRATGRRLRELRRKRMISRKLLADEAGVNASQICRVEAGQDARLSTLLKIFNGLGYRIDFELQETCEEAGHLLVLESLARGRRQDRGLLMGKRWR